MAKRKNRAMRMNTIPGLIFDCLNVLFFILVSIVFIMPFLHILNYSISDISKNSTAGFFWLPRGLELSVYVSIYHNGGKIMTAFGNSVFVTLIGTFIGLLVSSMLGYGITKPFRLRGVAVFMIFFTMIFNGGMVPTWLLIRNLGLLDSLWALILPGLVSAFNVFLLRNFMKMIPDSIEESVQIDGGGYGVIFFRFILPLSKPVLATVALMTAVGYWNDFFSTILYIFNRDKWPLAALIRDMINKMDLSMVQGGVVVGVDVSQVDNVKMRSASIIISMIPVLLVYPFAQKYFEKGTMVGAIKG